MNENIVIPIESDGESVVIAMHNPNNIEVNRNAVQALYGFFWNDFCDWYVELSKPILTGEDGPAKDETRACIAYVIGDAVFVGDTLFMPDYGTARTDFPGGDAHALYQSVQRLLALVGPVAEPLCIKIEGARDLADFVAVIKRSREITSIWLQSSDDRAQQRHQAHDEQTRDDRARVGEALVAVHHSTEFDSSLWVGKNCCQ